MAKQAYRSTALAGDPPAGPAAGTLRPSTGNSQLPAEARSAAAAAFESAVVDLFVSTAEPLGVPKSIAAIYGVIYASPVPLSFADIGERLDLSKGSISQGLRALRDIGAVRAVDDQGRAPARSASPSPIAVSPSPAHRAAPSPIALGPSPTGRAAPSPIALSPSPARSAVRYVPDTEMRQLIARFLESRVQPQLEAGKGRLTELRERTTAFAPAHRAILRQRVAKLESWHARARGLLPLVRTFLKLT